MTLPRRHLTGQAYSTDRATPVDSKYLALSNHGMQATFLYSFAKWCNRYGQVPAVLVVSDERYMAVSTDTTGDRSDFWRQHHSEVAGFGRGHYQLPPEVLFWSYGRPKEKIFLDEEAEIQGILRACAILLRQFDRVSDAPTVILPALWGEELVVPPPDPDLEAITIYPMPPPALQRRGVEEAKRIVNERIAELERYHARLRLEQEGHLLDSATEEDETNVASGERIRQLLDSMDEPDYKLYVGAKPLVDQAKKAHRVFWAHHDVAVHLVRAGKRPTFPTGTVWWRRIANMPVADLIVEARGPT